MVRAGAGDRPRGRPRRKIRPFLPGAVHYCMAGGRHTTPLFDLIRRDAGATPAAPPPPAAEKRETLNPGVGWRPGMAPRPAPAQSGPKPVVRLEVKPETGPMPARDDAAAPPPPPSGMYASIMGTHTVRVPINALYLATIVVVLLPLLGWALGFQWGTRRAGPSEADIRPPALVQEPAEQPAARQAQASPPATQRQQPTPTRPQPAQPTQPDSRTQTPAESPSRVSMAPISGGSITSKGYLAGDPRVSGHNYLALAIMPRDEAEQAVAFLSSHGSEAFAVPVESARRGANNPDPAKQPYRLFSAQGIASQEFSRSVAARNTLEATVARLGLRWQREFRGSSNFGKPGWELYK